MKRAAITVLLIHLLLALAFVSCSDKKGTGSATTVLTTGNLTGVWELTTIKADDVIITEDNDQWGVYREETITMNNDGTGIVVGTYPTMEFTWSVKSDSLMIDVTDDGEGEFSVKATLVGKTLTLFSPGEAQHNTPDLEQIYTRM